MSAPASSGGAPASNPEALQQRLVESETRFRIMADSAPVLLWMAGTDALCNFFNDGWLRFTGRTLGEEMGNGWAEGVHAEDFQRCMHLYLDSFVARKPFAMEYRLRRADGQYRWIYDQGTPRFEADGTFAGYIGSCIDVTDARQAREELTVVNGELRLRLEEREVLLREIYHRVKNNLQLVSSLLSMQGRQGGDAGVHASLEECRARVQTIALIHEQLYQSKDFSHVSFAAHVRSLAANVFQVTGASPDRVTLSVDVDEENLPVDQAIPCGLILNELITNALKHAFPLSRRGAVRVALKSSRPDGRILLSVADDGVGMPAAVDPRTTQSLGLQLVSTLAEQLEATLEIERTGGTTVRIRFGKESR